MGTAEWNFLEEAVATLVIRKGHSLASAISSVCGSNPEASAKALLLGSISFVTEIDLSTEQRKRSLLDDLARYKCVIALAADVSCLPTGKETCGDLFDLWLLTGDTVFWSVE